MFQETFAMFQETFEIFQKHLASLGEHSGNIWHLSGINKHKYSETLTVSPMTAALWHSEPFFCFTIIISIDPSDRRT
jgi:hypothetical protein